MFLPLEHANFFMAHGGQPIEVRANLLREQELDQLWRNYDFTFEPSNPIPGFAKAKL